MLRKVLLAALLLSLAGGCIQPKGGDNEPIVSPTNITNEVQDANDPVLPPYIPWWWKEDTSL